MNNKDVKTSTNGLLPDGWIRARIGSLCDIIRGVSYKKDQASEHPAKGKLPILRATNIQNNALVLDDELVYVPSELVSDTQKLRVGDIVVATSSGSKHLVGKTAPVRKPWEGSFGAFCAVVRPTGIIDNRYLGYFFESPEYRDYISKKALGVNINNLRRGDIEEISIPIAPHEQQKRIVAEIEKQFSRRDEAVANLKRVKANLKRYKAAVLKAAVEGKLTEEWRKKHPDVELASKLLKRFLAERPSLRKNGPLDLSRFPQLPAGWCWARIEDLGDVQLGRQRAPKYHKGSHMRPYLRVQNVFEDRIDLGDVMEMDFPPNDFQKFQLKTGDILLNEGQSPELLGRPAMYRGELPGACFTNTLASVLIFL